MDRFYADEKKEKTWRKTVRWFDKEEIKGKEALTTEQIVYLLQPSLTIWAPLNCIFRKHFDYLFAYVLVMIAIVLLSKPEDIGLLSAVYLLISVFLEGWLIYFFIKHGRRLAWNRSQWNDFESFKKSESRWLNFTVISFGAFFVQLFTLWRKEEDLTTIAQEIVGVLIIAFSIALPFFHAWRRPITAMSVIKGDEAGCGVTSGSFCSSSAACATNSPQTEPAVTPRLVPPPFIAGIADPVSDDLTKSDKTFNMGPL